MRNDALMVAEDQDRLLQAVDVVQLGLIDHMRGIGVDSPDSFARLMASQAVQQDLRDRIAGLPYIAALMLFDRHGRLLNFSRAWPPPAIDCRRSRLHSRDDGAGRAADVHQRSRRAARSPAEWEIYLSRRFEAADGRLLGFVVSTIEIDYFEQFYARLPLTGGGAFALYRRDGMLLARYPHARSPDRQDIRRHGEFQPLARRAGRRRGPADQPLRWQGSADRAARDGAFSSDHRVSDTMASMLRSWQWGIRILIATTVCWNW